MAEAALEKCGEADEDTLTYARRYYSYMENAQRLLEASEYNTAVANYDALTHDFPLSLLSPLIFVDAPEHFGA